MLHNLSRLFFPPARDGFEVNVKVFPGKFLTNVLVSLISSPKASASFFGPERRPFSELWLFFWGVFVLFFLVCFFFFVFFGFGFGGFLVVSVTCFNEREGPLSFRYLSF